MDKNCRRLAGAVLERALYDLRIPKTCERCGRPLPARLRSLKAELDREWTERERARAFLISERMEIWANAVGLDVDLVKGSVKEQSKKKRIICLCPKVKRKEACGLLSMVPSLTSKGKA
jgi:hypothetical protein